MNVELAAGLALFAVVLFWAGWIVRDLLDPALRRRRGRLTRRRWNSRVVERTPLKTRTPW